MLRAIILLQLVIILTSCQPKSEGSFVNPNPDVIATFTSTSQMESQLKKWKVNCLDPQKCPDSVGQLLITDGRTLTACTATLIGPDTVLTNSHCFDKRTEVSRGLIDPDLICQSGTRIVFAQQSPSGPEQLKCKKILTQSFLGENGLPPYLYPDYAVIQLEKSTQRKFDSVTRDGIENEMKLLIRKVNPALPGVGELEVETCEAQYQTLLTPLAVSSHYHVHIVRGCATRSGNSGSSLVSDDGKIRGILFQGIGAQSRAPRTAFEREILNRAETEKASFVANVSCMNHRFPGVENRDEKRCIQYKIQKARLIDAVNPEEIKNQFSDQVQSETQNVRLNNSFGYRLYFNSSNRTYLYSPHCVQLPEVSYSGIDYPISINTETLSWVPQIRVGSKMLAEVRSVSKKQNICTITVSYQDFYQRGRGIVRLFGSSCVDSEGQPKEGQDIWEVCKP